jgi:hypothetical protein
MRQLAWHGGAISHFLGSVYFGHNFFETLMVTAAIRTHDFGYSGLQNVQLISLRVFHDVFYVFKYLFIYIKYVYRRLVPIHSTNFA